MKEFPAKAGMGKCVRERTVFNVLNPGMAQGAALADVSMMSGFATDITQAAPDSAMVDADPEADPPCLRSLPE